CSPLPPPSCPLALPCSLTAAPPTQLYTLSLHDALPISSAIASSARRAPMPKRLPCSAARTRTWCWPTSSSPTAARASRPSTRSRSEEHTLNSSHVKISYAVFCLKKKKTQHTNNLVKHSQ